MNYLVYRYLLESGFTHSAFAFGHESRVDGGQKTTTAPGTIPPGALISFVQKGLQYCELEANLNEVRACVRRASVDRSIAREGRARGRARRERVEAVDRGVGECREM